MNEAETRAELIDPKLKACGWGVVEGSRIPILDFYAGDYRLEYDGKYVTLFGKDKNYKGFKFNDEDDDWFEEMVLIPVVEEIRNASPKIIEVTDTDIVVDLGCP